MKKKIVNKNVAGIHDSTLGRRRDNYLGKPPAYEPEDPDSEESCHDDHPMGVLTEEIKNLTHRTNALHDEIQCLVEILKPLLPEKPVEGIVVSKNEIKYKAPDDYPHIRTLSQCSDMVGSCHDMIRYLQQNVAT